MRTTIQQLEDLKEWAQDSTRYERRLAFRGGQLVQPGPGRQGYSGDWNPYAKSPKFQKFLKEWKGAKHRMADVVRGYEAMLSTEGKTVGFIELHKSLGKDNPYSEQTFRNIFNRANRKITKNTSDAEVASTKKAKRLQKIITDSLGEAELLGDIQKAGNWKYLDYTGTSKKNVWTLNKSKINKLNKALNKEFMKWGLQENTIDNVFDLANDKEFMKALKNYKGGAVDLDSALFKKVFKPGQSGELSYAYMQLGRILRGEIELEGIKKDKALGNKIIKSIFHKTARNSEGPMNTAASHWSRHQLAKDFDNSKATYESLRRTISDAFKDADIKNINVDEIFPLRTGQLTIGKGSGAFNNFVQFIDSNINQKAKRQFDGMASTRYQGIIDARKKGDWATVKKLVGDHENAINIFYENNPKARGKVKLPKLHYDEKTREFLKPSQVFDSQYGTGTYKAIPQKIRKGMEKFYTKTGLSLDPGTTMTLEKAAAEIKNNPTKFLKEAGFKIDKCLKLSKGGSPDQCIRGVIQETAEEAKKGNKAAQDSFKKSGRRLGLLFGWLDVPIEISFAAPHLLMGDVEAAKRATTFGLAGWGKVDLDNVDDPEARKYLKHRRDTEDWINNWEKHYHYSEKLKNLPLDASDPYRKQIEDSVEKFAGNMKSIQENYEGYDRSGSENENWAFNPEEMAGKRAAKNWIDTKVETDLDKQLAKTHDHHGDPFQLDISSPYADLVKEDLRKSPTDLESFIKTKGQDFWGNPEGWWFYRPLKEEEAEAHGVGNLYDDYYMGASEGKDIRDSYSSIPLEYASQLGALEAKEAREGLARYHYNPMSEMYYAGGGIAGVRRPNAIPPSSGPMPQGGGLSSQFNRVRKLTG